MKEADKNGGRSISVCSGPSEVLGLVSGRGTYVVQHHVPNPLLTSDGRKCHVKLYMMLQCAEDGLSWRLHAHRDAFLCVAEKRWSPDDLSRDAQVTIKRNLRLRPDEADGIWTGWPDCYDGCKSAASGIVSDAIGQNKLLGRPGQSPFEIFSSDFIVDADGEVWLIEFNFTPVLFDPLAGQELTTPGLREYMRLYKEEGERAQVNDRDMIRDAVSMAFYPDKRSQGGVTKWDPAGTFKGRLPASSLEGRSSTTVVGGMGEVQSMLLGL